MIGAMQQEKRLAQRDNPTAKAAKPCSMIKCPSLILASQGCGLDMASC